MKSFQQIDSFKLLYMFYTILHMVGVGWLLFYAQALLTNIVDHYLPLGYIQSRMCVCVFV